MSFNKVATSVVVFVLAIVFIKPFVVAADNPSPAWWSGDCNVNNHSGSYALGASFNGASACGPGTYGQGGYDHWVNFGAGVNVLEWQCVELAFRYMYLNYGVAPYTLTNGSAANIVTDYSGTKLVAKTNNGVEVPAPGDIVAMSYVHTAVVTAVNVNSAGTGTATILEQNGSATSTGSRTISVTNKVVGDNVTGWLHDPNSGTSEDFTIYRSSQGTWYTKAGPLGSSFIINGTGHGGWSVDIPMAGDFNLDGNNDLVIYRQGLWYVKDKNGNFIGPGPNGLQHGGWAEDIQLVGDMDGNGYDDFIIYRPSQGRWYTKSGPTGASYLSDVAHGGWAGDIPLVGDVNGDGKDDFVLYRSSTGAWYVKDGPGGGTFLVYGLVHGGHTDDKPLVGDYNGDGKADLVIYRASEGRWYVKDKNGNFIGPGPYGLPHGGVSGDIPLVANIAGDVSDDYIIYRQGVWYVKDKDNNFIGPGPNGLSHGGWAGDIPLAGQYGQ